MTTSMKRRAEYLRESVGPTANVEVVGAGTPRQRFEIQCRACRDESPVRNAPPAKRRVASEPHANAALLRWLEHEATDEHTVNARGL